VRGTGEPVGSSSLPLFSLTSASGQRTSDHAIREFVASKKLVDAPDVTPTSLWQRAWV
jgi:hypothetical protein